jgi:hypothetical protein
MTPNLDCPEGDHFIARRAGVFYEIVNKESGEVAQTTVADRVPRNRFGKPLRSRIEASKAVLNQDNLFMRALIAQKKEG